MKKILITCDTEVGELSSSVSNAFEVFIEGKIDKQTVGYQLINQVAEKYSAKVSHFVDIYPFERYGENKFSQLCRNILSSGHELLLHTHPSGRFDKNRKFMHQYNYEEQVKIINWGQQKIKEWTGRNVIAHRAGGYGANNDTLRALQKNNIFIDSSYYANNQNCKIHLKKINATNKINEIFEIPVTIYEKNIKSYSFRKKPNLYQKLDFRYGASVSDILQTIEEMPNNLAIVLFLHSFNFLNLPYNLKTKRYGKISVNSKLINDYEFLLNAISKNNNCQFTTFEELETKKIIEDKVPIIKKKNISYKKIKNKNKHFNE